MASGPYGTPGIPGAGVATKLWDLSASSITELADLL
jgi:hypothetical protein